MKLYYVLREELIFYNGVILQKQICLRHSARRLGHETHINTVKCKARLRNNFSGHISILKSRFSLQNATRIRLC